MTCERTHKLMNRSSTALLEFALGEDGATMAEYGLMILLVAGVCVGAVSLLGRQVAQMLAVPGL